MPRWEKLRVGRFPSLLVSACCPNLVTASFVVLAGMKIFHPKKPTLAPPVFRRHLYTRVMQNLGKEEGTEGGREGGT